MAALDRERQGAVHFGDAEADKCCTREPQRVAAPHRQASGLRPALPKVNLLTVSRLVRAIGAVARIGGVVDVGDGGKRDV